MPVPGQASTSNNVIVDIPPVLIKNGSTLIIEKYSEICIEGIHLSRPANFIKQINGMCLVDTQQPERRSSTASRQLEPAIDKSHLVRIIINCSPESLNMGKIVTIEKIDSTKDGEPSGNVADLFNTQVGQKSTETRMVSIKIPKQYVETGKIIMIQKGKAFLVNSEAYWKDQANPLTNNRFTKRDYLQSKNLMEITIDVPPELFRTDQTISFRKEDSQLLAASFPYRRQSRCEAQLPNRDNLKCDRVTSIEDFLTHHIWNPALLEQGHLLQLRIELTDQTSIQSKDQIKITVNEQTLSVETSDRDGLQLFRQVVLPANVQVNQFKHQFDEQRRQLTITIPVQ